MVQSILETGLITKEMEEVYKSGQMDQDTLVNGKMIKQMAKESSSMLMEMYMRVSG